MFRETLLESAPGARRRKRWPMVLAVVLEATVCSILVAIPLLSTGIIPVAAQTQGPIQWVEPPPIVHERPVAGHDGGRGPAFPTARIVTVADGKNHLTFGDPVRQGDDAPVTTILDVGPSGPALPICNKCSSARPRGPERSGPYTVSDLTEGYLLHRVEPVYPRMALLTGVGGEVRLHAIIAKDGTIVSLTVISGHPMLARAAMDAVEQWRYRPYLLNHEPVEVETLITVNFSPGH